MENIKIFFFIGFLTIIINFFFSKLGLINDKKKISQHKIFINSSLTPPFSGGIILMIILYFFLWKGYFNYSILFFLIFLVGFLSDINILKSPNIRFFLQIFFLIFFVSILDISIGSIKIDFFDNLLQYKNFNIFFSAFCLLILINGTNFIDGLNTLVIGYYLLVLVFINLVINDFSYNLFSIDEFVILFSILFFLFFLNFFEFLYLGDNGAYLISIFFGVYLINIYAENSTISPYYIMNLLWYPAYENFFSIIRKIKFKYSAFKPDNLHLHQMIYTYFERKFKITKYNNTLAGSSINFFNLLIFCLATINYSNSKYQLLITTFSLLVYNLIYYSLYKYKKK